MSRSMRTLVTSATIGGLALTGCSASASDVPELSALEENMWETMAASDAVGITGALPETMGQDATIIEDMFGGNLADVQIYGSLQEPATAIQLGQDQEPIMYFFGDDAYIEMSAVLSSLDGMFPGATPEQQAQMEQAAVEFEGRYLDISEDFAGTDQSIDMSELLDQMQSAAQTGHPDPVTGFDFGQLQQEGSYQQLDMDSDDTGWFYSDTGLGENSDATSSATDDTFHYIAVTSDQDSPRLEQVRTGEQHLMKFSWDDEVDIPQRPNDDELVTEEDFTNLGQ